MPYSYTLKSMDELLQMYFKGSHQEIIDKMKKALSIYCNHLFDSGIKGNCDKPAEDVKISKSCRLC